MAIKKKDLKELREKLESERNRILNHLKDLKGSSTQDSDALIGDSADIASIESSQASIAKLGEREKKVLKLINHALDKMDNDPKEYGICEYSGEEIPLARLKISPWSKYTVEAKEEIERHERGFSKNKSQYDDDSNFDNESSDD